MKTKTGDDYRRILRACGFDGPNCRERRGLRSDVASLLELTLGEVGTKFADLLAAAKEEIRHRPLGSYQRESQLEAAWQLLHLSPGIAAGDTFKDVSPEKAGWGCDGPGGVSVFLCPEGLEALLKFDGERVLELWRMLNDWRRGLCAIWAGTIVRGMATLKKRQSEAKLLPGDTAVLKSLAVSGPIGSSLMLADLTDQEVDQFHTLCEQARFGSVSCERDAADALKTWLERLSLSNLITAGLSLPQAQLLLRAASQHQPCLDVELRWDSTQGGYRFEGLIRNLDRHGYRDQDLSAGIPLLIAQRFFNEATPAVRQDWLRLVIRAGHQKARDLLSGALESSLD